MKNQELIESLLVEFKAIKSKRNTREYSNKTFANKKLELFKTHVAYQKEWEEVFLSLNGEYDCYIQAMRLGCPAGGCETCVKEKMYDLLLYNMNHTRIM